MVVTCFVVPHVVLAVQVTQHLQGCAVYGKKQKEIANHGNMLACVYVYIR